MQSNLYFTSYPVMQVRTWGLLVYERKEWHYKPKKDRTPLNTTNHHSNKYTTDSPNNQYSGSLTPFAKRKLKRAIQLLVASSKDKEAPNFKTGGTFKFKVNFITLTLPAPQGNISDKELKSQCLDPWIKRMRRQLKLNNYVWRAERQENGNLHFHFITDTYLHYQKIRDNWNEVLNKFNFINEFEAKHGHRNPNSTDVHAVWKVKNLTQYFIKYMSKETPNGMTIEGKLWDCSKALKTKENCESLLETEVLDTWTKAISDPEIEVKTDTNYTLAFFRPHHFKKYVVGELARKWTEYLTRIREGTREEEPHPVRRVAP